MPVEPVEKNKPARVVASQSNAAPAQKQAVTQSAAPTSAAWTGYVKSMQGGAAPPAKSADAMPPNTAAWGDEVHGIPANAQARDDASVIG